MANMDPVIKAMSALKRDLKKSIFAGETPQDKTQLLNFAYNELEKIRGEVLSDFEKKAAELQPGLFDKREHNAGLQGAEAREFGGVRS